MVNYKYNFFPPQISELKRINNFHKENEIFAHQSIKVPVQAFSLLTEATSNNLASNETGPTINDAAATSNGDTLETEDDVFASREKQIINLISKPIVATIVQPHSLEMEQLASTIVQSHESRVDTDEFHCDVTGISESDRLLGSSEYATTDGDATQSLSVRFADSLSCSGDDWGISWMQLLGFSLLLGFAGPIIYILYLTDFSSSSHHHLTHH